MPAPDPSRICRGCRHWRPTDNLADDLAKLGQCRHRSPGIFAGAEPGKLLTRFPLVREDADCGQWSEMTQAQKEIEARA